MRNVSNNALLIEWLDSWFQKTFLLVTIQAYVLKIIPFATGFLVEEGTINSLMKWNVEKVIDRKKKNLESTLWLMKKKISIWGYVFNLISLVSSLSVDEAWLKPLITKRRKFKMFIKKCERFGTIYEESNVRIGDGKWGILESRLFF